MVSTLDRLTYAARQTARVAWYAGHYAAGRRLLKPMPKPAFPIGPTPSRAEMTADMRALFEREWQDIEAGLFPAPRARGPEPAEKDRAVWKVPSPLPSSTLTELLPLSAVMMSGMPSPLTSATATE